MSRPPALSPQQQEDVKRRLAAGEGVRALAREFKVGDATIRRLSAHTAQIRRVAETLAAAHTELALLPIQHQHQALTLADSLRAISADLAGAARYGAATAHRLQALANSEVQKVDDADPMSSVATLQGIGALTKLANDSAVNGLSLLNANRDRAQGEPPQRPQVDPTKVSDAALLELLNARI